MNWTALLRWTFFLLPFTMFMGIAVQAIGLYLFILLAPLMSIFFAQKTQNQICPPFYLKFVPLALLLVWLLFPLANGFSALTSKEVWIANATFEFDSMLDNHLNWKKFLESRFSSAWLFSVVGLALVNLGIKKNYVLPFSRDEILKKFMLGLSISAGLWILFLAFQHFSGFDPKSASRLLKQEHRMANGTYRVFGAYGHPLSVASVAMALMVFFWTLFCNCLVNVQADSPFFHVFKNLSKKMHSLFYFLVSFLFFLGVVMSGGRTALAISIVAYCLIPILAAPSRKLRWISLAAAGICSAVMVMIIFAGNFLSRFEQLLVMIRAGKFENRGHFWKVYGEMISDSPWFGYGHYFIEGGLRDFYYQQLGFGALKEKFNAHNVYLETVSNIGIVGVLCMILLLIFVCRQMAKAAQQCGSSSVGLYFRCLSAAFIVNLAHGLTQNVFFDSNVMICYIVLFFVGNYLLTADTVQLETNTLPYPIVANLKQN